MVRLLGQPKNLLVDTSGEGSQQTEERDLPGIVGQAYASIRRPHRLQLYWSQIWVFELHGGSFKQFRLGKQGLEEELFTWTEL